MQKYASIDIGTNSVRLCVMELQDGEYGQIHGEAVVTRLGRNMTSDGCLQQEAMEETTAVLLRYRDELLTRYALDEASVIVIATSAVREALNRAVFLERVENIVGWKVRVISGEQEAALSFLGALRTLYPAYTAKAGANGPQRVTVIDIGGGSTEFITGSFDAIIEKVCSLPLGIVRLTERCVGEHPVPQHVLAAMDSAAAEALRPLAGWQNDAAPLVAVGGTATSAAALHHQLREYQRDVVNHTRLKRTVVETLQYRLARMTLEERRFVPGLQSGREDVIVAGLGILGAIMEFLGKEEVIVSDGDLLQGVLFAARE